MVVCGDAADRRGVVDLFPQNSDDRPTKRTMSGDRFSLSTSSNDVASPCFDVGAAEEYLDAPFGLPKGDVFEMGVGRQVMFGWMYIGGTEEDSAHDGVFDVGTVGTVETVDFEGDVPSLFRGGGFDGGDGYVAEALL